MTRKVNKRIWTYCDSEGFWWNEDNSRYICRSNRNQNIWQLVEVSDPTSFVEEFPTMKKAMSYGS